MRRLIRLPLREYFVKNITAAADEKCFTFFVDAESAKKKHEHTEKKTYTSMSQTFGTQVTRELFLLGGISKISFEKDSITVCLKEQHQFEEHLKREITAVLEKDGQPMDDDDFCHVKVLAKENQPQHQDNLDIDEENDSNVLKKIKAVLKVKVQPILQSHSGDVTFIKFDEKKGAVYLSLTGACADCPMSQQTLENVIQKELCTVIPEVTKVINK